MKRKRIVGIILLLLLLLTLFTVPAIGKYRLSRTMVIPLGVVLCVS